MHNLITIIVGKFSGNIPGLEIRSQDRNTIQVRSFHFDKHATIASGEDDRG